MKTSISGIQKRQLCICFTAIVLFILSLVLMLRRNEMNFFTKEPYYYVIRSCIMALPFAFLGVGSIYAAFGGKRIHINVRWIPFILILLQAGLTFLGMYAGGMWDNRPPFTGFGHSDHFIIPYSYAIRPFYQNICLGIAVFQVLFSIFVIPSVSRRWVIRSYSIAMTLVNVILFCTEVYTQSVATYGSSVGYLQVFRPSILFYLASNVFLQFSVFDFGDYLNKENRFSVSFPEMIAMNPDEEDWEKDILPSSDLAVLYGWACIFNDHEALKAVEVLKDFGEANIVNLISLSDKDIKQAGQVLLDSAQEINGHIGDCVSHSGISSLEAIADEKISATVRRSFALELSCGFSEEKLQGLDQVIQNIWDYISEKGEEA